MPDYIMRWLASRFLDADTQEELGIMTAEVRARKQAQDAAMSVGVGHGDADECAVRGTGGAAARQRRRGVEPQPAHRGAHRHAARRPGALSGLDLGPACSQCGGMMQRTGACYTCTSCGNNTGCG